MPERPTWVVILHGGCKPIEPEEAEPNRRGLEAALGQATAVLSRGGGALDAVEAAVRAMEDDPTFNAGRGGSRDADGRQAFDAAIMDGATLDVGAICAAYDIANPISAARELLREEENLLARDGATRFAAEKGLQRAGAREGPRRRASADTVGCVALDIRGQLAAGTSTGGLDGARAGRVGDSPLAGCGVYADNQAGALSASGVGETIMRAIVGARVMFALEQGEHPDRAIEGALRHLDRVDGVAGVIALDPAGRIGWKHNKDQFAVGWASSVDPTAHIELAGMEAQGA